MTARQRATRWTAYGAAAAALLLSGGEARAAGAETAALATTVIAFGVADIMFVVHDIDAAIKNQLAQDGWLYAEAVVAAPQVALFNTILVGTNAADEDFLGQIATFFGILPTAGVNALMVHGIWGLTSDRPPADANAGISVLVGTNFALSMSSIGRALNGRLHTRPVGVLELILAGTTTAISAYESSISRPQQAPWLALTGWSSALALHGVLSAVIPDERERRTSRAGTWWPRSFVMTPTVLGGGPAPVPAIVAAGQF